MRKVNLAAALFSATLLVTAGHAAAEDYEIKDPAAFAKAFAGATVTLDQALKAGRAQGTPISAKYELDARGAIQLSVYVMKTGAAGEFAEILLDPKTGAVAKSEPITDPGDKDAAMGQSAAVAKATMPLDQAAAKAAADNPGYKVVSVIPEMRGPNPFAEIFVIKDTDVKKTAQKLN